MREIIPSRAKIPAPRRATPIDMLMMLKDAEAREEAFFKFCLSEVIRKIE